MADRIMKRIRGKGRGWVFRPKHFINFGSRGSVDVAIGKDELCDERAYPRRRGRGPNRDTPAQPRAGSRPGVRYRQRRAAGARQLGKAQVDADVIRRLATRIDDRALKQLLQARPAMPGWMGDVILKIGTAHDG